jgi:hypothetical protein
MLLILQGCQCGQVMSGRRAELQEVGILSPFSFCFTGREAIDQRKMLQVRQKVLDKSQSKRIWGKLFKGIDSSVVIHVLDARDHEGRRCNRWSTLFHGSPFMFAPWKRRF